MTQIKLLELIESKHTKHYSQSNIANRLRNNSLRFEEMQMIFDVLGYDLKLDKK